jgi:hypothetical protein
MTSDVSHEFLTTSARYYGVACKNRSCTSGIVLGTFLTELPTLNETLIRCPDCKQQSAYSRRDLLELARPPGRSAKAFAA